MTTRHLDLGCGAVPRNPFHCEALVGMDVRPPPSGPGPTAFQYVQGNLVLDPLPFPDRHFDSISAYDVIEHVPRQLHVSGVGLIYPFVRLMNEIHRVLKPGGHLLATTPGYPRPEAFQDPTHVNFITVATAEYFTGDSPKGHMYGFTGHFEQIENRFCIRNNWVDDRTTPTRRLLRRWHRRWLRGGLVDIVWLFRAVK